MTEELTNQTETKHMLDRISASLKSYLHNQGTDQEIDIDDEVHKASQKEMARQLRDRRMSQAIYGYLTAF